MGVKPKADPGRKVPGISKHGRRKAETYRGYRRNAIYGRLAAGNTPLDLRRAIRGVAAALARQQMIPTRRQLAELTLEVKKSRKAG